MYSLVDPRRKGGSVSSLRSGSNNDNSNKPPRAESRIDANAEGQSVENSPPQAPPAAEETVKAIETEPILSGQNGAAMGEEEGGGSTEKVRLTESSAVAARPSDDTRRILFPSETPVAEKENERTQEDPQEEFENLQDNQISDLDADADVAQGSQPRAPSARENDDQGEINENERTSEEVLAAKLTAALADLEHAKEEPDKDDNHEVNEDTRAPLPEDPREGNDPPAEGQEPPAGGQDPADDGPVGQDPVGQEPIQQNEIHQEIFNPPDVPDLDEDVQSPLGPGIPHVVSFSPDWQLYDDARSSLSPVELTRKHMPPPENLDKDILRSIQVNDETLTKLSLERNRLTDVDMFHLAKSLDQNKVIEAIDLSGNEFSREGLLFLAKLLASGSSKLLVIKLSQNPQIIDYLPLGKALSDNQTIIEIDLSDNAMTADSMVEFAEGLQEGDTSNTLRRLDVSYNNFGDEGMTALASWIASSMSLIALLARDTEVGEEGGLALGKALRENTSMEMLDLARNKVGPKAATSLMESAIQPSTRLSHVYLDFNVLGEAGGLAVAKALPFPSCNLTYLHLSNNKLGDKGIIAIGEALLHNDSAVLMDLSSNDCTRAVTPAFEKALEKNRTITKIDLKGNELGIMLSNKLMRRNRLLRDHQQLFEEMGPSLYMHAVDGSVQWTARVVESAKVDEGQEWLLIHRALRYVASGSDEERLDNYRDLSDASQLLYKLCRDKDNLSALMRTTLEDKNTLLHYTVASEASEAFRLSKFMVTALDADLDGPPNKEGLTIREIGKSSPNMETRVWCERKGLLLQRYSINGGIDGAPVYRSLTCMVVEGEDLAPAKDDDDILVSIVSFEDKRDFLRELACRVKALQGNTGSVPDDSLRFNADSVLRMLRFHDSKSAEAGNHSIVMPRFERNLQHIIHAEFIAGRDVKKITSIAKSVAKAIDNVHENRIAHCCVCPRRIVRHEGKYKLMGFELALGFGKEVVTRRTLSQYCPPELAKVLMNGDGLEELEERLMELRKEQRDLANQAVSKETDTKLREVVLEIYRVQALVDLTPKEGSRPNIPKASAAIDVWSYGVVLFELLTGESLIPGATIDDGLASFDDKVTLASFQGLSQAQLDRVLATEDVEIPKSIIRRAQDLLLRCLHPDPESRYQTMSDVLSHRFLTQVPPMPEDDIEVLAPIAAVSSQIQEIAGAKTPTCFLLLPFKLEIDTTNTNNAGKIVPPKAGKPYFEALVRMQEFNALQQLLNSYMNRDAIETQEFLDKCNKMELNEAADTILRSLGVTDSSLLYFRRRISDLRSFVGAPIKFLEQQSGLAFHNWWKYYQQEPCMYFYIVDEYYQRPVVLTNGSSVGMYPVELKAASATARDLVPFLCLNLTSVNILMAVASLTSPNAMASNTSLPSRLKEKALLDLDRLNRQCTMTDYDVLHDAFEKLSNPSDSGENQDVGEQVTPRFRKFSSVNDALLYELEVFFDKHDPEGQFGGLGWVLDRDGMVRWTSKEGQAEMKHIETLSMAEHLSRKRQLEEALREVEQKLKLEELKTAQASEQLGHLLLEKKALLDNKKNLERYIEEQRIAAQQCCVIL